MTLQLLSKQQEGADRDSHEEEPGAARQEGSRGAQENHAGPVQHSPAQGAAFPAGPGEATAGSSVSEREGESAPVPAEPRAPGDEQVTQRDVVSEDEKVQEEHLSPESCLGPEHAEEPVPAVDKDLVPAEPRQESSRTRKAETERSPSRISLQTAAAEPSVVEAKPAVADVAALAEEPAEEQKAAEAVKGLEPPPLNGEGRKCTDPPDESSSEKEPALVPSTAEQSSAVTRASPGRQDGSSSPKRKDSR